MQAHVSKAAFFDVDGVIIPGNGSTTLQPIGNEIIMKEGILRVMQDALPLMLMQVLHSFGMIDDAKFKRITLSFLKGKQSEQYFSMIEGIYNKSIRPKIYSPVIEEIEKRRNEGYKVVLDSNSLDVVLKYIARDVKADDLICSRLETDLEGRFTGKVLDFNYGRYKHKNLLAYAEREQISLEKSWFYTDSLSDAKCLQAVGYKVAVNPDIGLKRFLLKHLRDNPEDRSWRIMPPKESDRLARALEIINPRIYEDIGTKCESLLQSEESF